MLSALVLSRSRISLSTMSDIRNDSLGPLVLSALNRFTAWLDAFGETSWDHQSFFAGPIGGRAKSLYYQHKLLGTAAVAPMIFFEAFVPSARRLFHRPTRFPIADAHYAMGFAYLYEATGEPERWTRAEHFLDVLQNTRCPRFIECCWGYPFDWVTRNGTITAQTPLITSTPYIYEAFLQCENLAGGRAEWRQIMASIGRHAAHDIKDFPVSETSATCSYTPYDKGGVVNAAAYRAFLLTSASRVLAVDCVLADGATEPQFRAGRARSRWLVALCQVDGVRDFVDHFHTCFVMKALAKIHALTGHERTFEALGRGIDYYMANLFDADALPRPFAKAPRLTIYKRELYDCAECINLCLLLRDRFPQLNATLERVVTSILREWVKPDGSFRSRLLLKGWDNVPMHRWAQSQMFRSLAAFAAESRDVGIASRGDVPESTGQRLAPAAHAI